MAGNNIQIHLIGEFQLRWGDFVLNRNNFPRRKGRDLLKLLAFTPGHCCTGNSS
jgi:hypothetical protein